MASRRQAGGRDVSEGCLLQGFRAAAGPPCVHAEAMRHPLHVHLGQDASVDGDKGAAQDRPLQAMTARDTHDVAASILGPACSSIS